MSHPIGRRALLATALATPALAQQQETWPERPVRIIVPFAQGGPVDVVTRLLGEHLQTALGKPFVPDYRLGAGGNIGAQALMQAQPDGHTLLATLDSLMTINPLVFPNPGFDPADFTPVGTIASMASVVTVPAASPARDMAGLIALGRQRVLTFGSGGVGTPAQLYGELMKLKTGAQMEHVPFRGLAPAVIELLAERLDFIPALIPGVSQHIAAGRLRPLAVTSLERSPFLPEVPTLAETILPGLDAGSWVGLYGPKGMSPAITQILVREIAAFAAKPVARERLAASSLVPMGGTPQALRTQQANDTARWAEVVRVANIRMD